MVPPRIGLPTGSGHDSGEHEDQEPMATVSDQRPDVDRPSDHHPRTDGDALRPAMADLAHVVHNASNLVLGHVAGIQRGVDDPARLAERIGVIEAALGRITGVVDALRASLDPQCWSPPQAMPVDEVVDDAFRAAGAESSRRRIRLHREPAPLGEHDPSPMIADGTRAVAMLAALLGCELERLGSNGSVRVAVRDGGPGAVRIDVTIERDDGLALHRGETRSVWAWIAERIGDQFGATLEHPDASSGASEAATDAIVVPITPGVRPR